LNSWKRRATDWEIKLIFVADVEAASDGYGLSTFLKNSLSFSW
jgi:hypothetical protein